MNNLQSALKKSGATVVGRNGLRGVLDPSDAEGKWAGMTLDSGEHVWVDRTALTMGANGEFQLDLAVEDLRRGAEGGVYTVIPVIQEQVTIDKRTIEMPGVRVIKKVREQIEHISVPLQREEVSIERIPVKEFVSVAPTVREEGTTTIVPVIEEVLVVEKRIFVRELIRISKKVVVESSPEQQVVLRIEEVRIEEIPVEPIDSDRA